MIKIIFMLFVIAITMAIVYTVIAFISGKTSVKEISEYTRENIEEVPGLTILIGAVLIVIEIIILIIVGLVVI